MPTSDQLQKLQGLQQQMVPIEAIADEIGVSSSTIYRWLKTLPKFERRAPRNVIDQLSFHQDYITLRMEEGETQPKTILKEIKDRGYTGSKKTLTNYMTKTRRTIRSQRRDDPAPAAGTPTPGDDQPRPQPQPQFQKRRGMELTTLIDITTPEDTQEPTLLSPLCTDDTGLLSTEPGDHAVLVKMTRAGIVYAERDGPIIPQAQVLVMTRLDTEKFDREHAADLMTHQGPTTVSALMNDIDSLKDLLQINPQELATPPEEPPARLEIQAPDDPGRRIAPQQDSAVPEFQTAGANGRFRRSRTLPGRDSATDPGTDPGPAADAKPGANHAKDGPSRLEAPTAKPTPEPAPFDHAAIIADAWRAVPDETHLQPKIIERVILKIADEIAQAAGHPLQRDGATTLAATDIGKGFKIEPARLLGGVSISRTTQEGVRTGYLAAVATAHQGTGVRDPQFHTHITWWTPEDGPKEVWLENTLRENAARFISECQ